ncbi:MAG: hypothetical protein JSR63_07940 [Proteobacteria bacterium]|nr:hypothetical protein [Pseudomonadota bacterium]
MELKRRFMLEELTDLLLQSPTAKSQPPPNSYGISAPGMRLDTSKEARLRRQIARIADRYHWWSAVTMFLDNRALSSLEELSRPQLEDLLDRMNGYVDAAEHACDLPDDLPAR